MILNRRIFLSSLASLPFAANAHAQGLPPAILALMNHPAAGFFETPPANSGIPLNLPIKTKHGSANWQSLFSGRAVLLDLWASWCAPCLVETPGLNTLSARYGSQDFSVVVLKTADPKTSFEQMQQIFSDGKYHALSAFADNSSDGWGFFRALKVNNRSSGASAGLPMAALIGPDGREIARTYGTIKGRKWDHPQIADFIGKFARAWSLS